jgi:hypothetical protein
MDDLLWWFDGAFDKLRVAGYVLATYEVPEDAVVFLTRQVAFDYDRAEYIDAEEIPSV